MEDIAHLDLTKHRYRSNDGRHWSTPEMKSYLDGEYGSPGTDLALRKMLLAWHDRNARPTDAYD